MMVPTVHLNGTSRDGLVQPLIAAIEALNVALVKMYRTMPNGRDYYTQGPDACDKAMAEYFDRVQRVSEVNDELQALAKAI